MKFFRYVTVHLLESFNSRAISCYLLPEKCYSLVINESHVRTMTEYV